MKFFENENGYWINVEAICTAIVRSDDKSIMLKMLDSSEIKVEGDRYQALMNVFAKSENPAK